MNYTFQTLQLLKLPSNADSVEWCPVDPYKSHFVCGTYTLLKNDSTSSGNELSNARSTRVGELYLYELTENIELNLHHTIETSAILDMKWSNVLINDNVLLAAATADGEIIIWRLSRIQNHTSLEHVNSCKLGQSGDTLALSLDWSTGYGHKCGSLSNEGIIVSGSNGVVFLLQLNDAELVVQKSWKAHNYEAWITAFNYWNNSIIFTGGDDGLLKVYDTRLDVTDSLYENKDHNAGVTSLRCNHIREFSFASGSYDETVKLWDTRKMNKSVYSLNISGGVWRIKWRPIGADFLLIAAMYNGFHLLKNKDVISLDALCSYKLPNSLSYGADLCYLSSGEVLHLCSKLNINNVTNDVMLSSLCTFYDSTLIISLITPIESE